MDNDQGHMAGERLAELRRATRFLTRLPLGDEAAAPGALAGAAWAFPVIGAGIGLAGALAFLLATAFGLPPLPAALLALVVPALVSGGLHEDGLADTVDGLSGGHSASEALEIMRDSRIGAMGALALIFAVGLRASALAVLALAAPALAAAALVAAASLARAALPVFLWLEPPARGDGLAVEAGRPSGEGAAAALGIGVVLAVLALATASPSALAATFAAALLGAWAMAALAVRRLGGVTGDVLGAIAVVTETAALLALAATAL